MSGVKEAGGRWGGQRRQEDRMSGRIEETRKNGGGEKTKKVRKDRGPGCLEGRKQEARNDGGG